MTLLISVFTIIVSLSLLAYSADKFVEGASSIAYQFGLSPLLIGLTVVSLGTSAPEILIGVMSAFSGNSALAIGNAIGSNIANIALILGFSSMLMPLPVASTVLRREIPLLLCVVLFSTALLLDLKLTRGDGIAYIGVLLLCLGWLIWQGKKEPEDVLAAEFDDHVSAPEPMAKLTIITIAALIVLLVSSRALVWGAVEIARAANVSELMIGLSIVAIGTSLPELAATIASIMRREFGLAIGGVVGSNLFNALAVLGVVAIIGPVEVDAMVRNRDAVVHIGLTVCLLIFCVAWRGNGGRINRVEGLALLAVFIGYQWLLFMQEGA